jgi:hypothetical protein
MKRTKAPTSLLFFAASLAVLFSCGRNGMQGNQTIIPVKNSEVRLATYQDAYPGVFSNLKKTRSYAISMLGEFEPNTQAAYLWVDSVKLNIGHAIWNDERMTGSQYLLNGQGKLDLFTSRNYYQPAPGMDLDQVEYMKTDTLLPQFQGMLEFIHQGKSFFVRVPKIQQLESIYAP